jgi:hypothetical protein
VTWVFDKENIARQRLGIAIPKRGSGWRPESTGTKKALRFVSRSS